MGRLKKSKTEDWKQKVQDLFASVQDAPADTQQALVDSIQGEMNKLLGSTTSEVKDEDGEEDEESPPSTYARPVRNRTPSVRLKDSEVGYNVKIEPKDEATKGKGKRQRKGRKDAVMEIVDIDPETMETQPWTKKAKVGDPPMKELIVSLERIDELEGNDFEITEVVQGRMAKKMNILAIPTDAEIDEVEGELVKAEVHSVKAEAHPASVSEDSAETQDTLEAVDDILREVTEAPEQFEDAKNQIATEEMWFPDEEELPRKRGKNRVHEAEIPPATEGGKRRSRKPKQCEHCGKSVVDLKKHMLFHRIDELPFMKCPECDYQSKFKDNLFRHRQVKHSTARPHVCPDCGEGFVNKTKLRTHLSYVHGDGRAKRFQCDQCSFATHTTAILRRHQSNKHEDTKVKFECDICHLQLSYKGTFEVHMRRHTGKRPFQCSVCDSSFRSSSTLNQHEKTHIAKSFICPVCGKAFLTKHHMERHHDALHTAVKNHACPFCRYVCNNPFNLRKHCAAQHQKVYPPRSRSNWRASLPPEAKATEDHGTVENAAALSELGVTLQQLPDGHYMVNEQGQIVHGVTEGEQPQEVIYIKPDASEGNVQEINVNDLQNAEVLEKEHIPVSDSVWESIQTAMANGQEVNLEELLKSNNVLIQVKGEEEVKEEAAEEEEEEMTYLVIEPQEGEVTSDEFITVASDVTTTVAT